MRWGAAIGVAGVLALLFIGLKVGGELRDQNCLKRVELEYPTAFSPGAGLPSLSGGEEGQFDFFRRSDREQALTQCHRWP